MPDAREPVLSGGCQCGAVRYALYAEPRGAHVCHCRMCQKAFGSYFAPLAAVALEDLAWTRGRPAVFMSSAVVERGFCERCGTPLTIRDTDRAEIDISLGSLDQPARVVPERQYGIEARMPWFHELAGLPGITTEADVPPDRLRLFASRQHPDHDTPAWPPEPPLGG